MRKLFLVLTTFVFLNSSFAQKTVYNSINFGMKGGINVSGIHGSLQDSLSTKYKNGFQLGVFTKYYISDDFKAGFELNLTRKGFKADIYDSIFGLNIYTQNYYQIELPLFLEYNIAANTSVELGVSYALTFSNEKVNFPPINPFKEDNKDISGFIGMNYDVDEFTQIGFRYSYGINPIIETANNKAYSSNFQLLFRIRLL